MKFMNNKGIAIQTILLLLIGVLVAGLLVYYTYRYFSGSALSREECRARAVSWCTGCWNAMNAKGSECADWEDSGTCGVGPDPSEELENCVDDYYPGYDLTGVTNCHNQDDFCKNFIPM